MAEYLPGMTPVVAIMAVMALAVMTLRLFRRSYLNDLIYGATLMLFLVSSGYLDRTIEMQCLSDLDTGRQEITIRLSDYPDRGNSGYSVRGRILTVKKTDPAGGQDESGSLPADSVTRSGDSLTQPGDYTVTLVVSNAGGSSAPKTDVINVLRPATAQFQASPTTGNAPLTVTFTDQSAGDGLSSWNWDFGDGETEVRTSGSPFTHEYLSSGNYTAKLTVTGSCGTSPEETRTINVQSAPVADFTAAPNPVCPGVGVLFTDASSGAFAGVGASHMSHGIRRADAPQRSEQE